MRKPRLKRDDEFSHAMIIVSSATASSSQLLPQAREQGVVHVAPRVGHGVRVVDGNSLAVVSQ